MSLLEVLPHTVDISKFTSLAEHQSRTPSSFYDAPPILHFRAENCKIQITNDLLAVEGPLQAVFGPPPASVLNSPPKVPVQINFEGVQVVAASDAFLFSSPATNKTLSIPYPLITLHAIQHSPSLSSPTSKLFSIYLQISPASSSEDDDLMELIITPHLPIHKSSTAQTSTTTPDAMAMDTIPGSETNHSQESLTKAMFAALTCCADLHPTNTSGAMGFFDDEDEEDDDGTDDEQEDAIAFEGPVGYGDEMDVDHTFTKIKKKSSKGIGSAGMPGDGGWITSENVHLLEKVKVEGGLGPGAGSVRPREEDDDEEEDSGAANGDSNLNGGKEGTEAKWRRTG